MRTKTNDNLAKINHHGFVPFIATLALLAVVMIFLQIFLKPFNRCEVESVFNSIGIATQIITAIVVCVLQVMGISFSIQTNEFAGMKLYELREIRKDKHFSFRATAIISISFLLINVIGYFFHWYFVCIGACLCSFLFCIYVITIEMPLLTMKESTLLSIIKDQIIVQSEQIERNELLQSKYISVIKHYICEKDIRRTYQIFQCENDPAFNKKLLNMLLDIQAVIALNIKDITDKKELTKTVDSLLGGTVSILNGSFDITAILGNNKNEYQYQITGVLLQLMNCAYSHKVINRLGNETVWINCRKMNLTQKQLFIDVLVVLITASIKENNFDLISELRMQYSQWYFSFDKDISGLIFATTSFFLFYIVTLNREVSQDLRNSINAFIKESGTFGRNSVLSWRSLFHKYSATFKLDYSDFYETYRRNEDCLDYMTISGFAHTVVLSDKIVNDWFIAQLLNKEVTFNDDYNTILANLENGKIGYYLEGFIRENYKDGVFKPDDTLRAFAGFFADNDRLFDCFSIDENRSHKFYSFYEKRKNEKLDSFTKECEKISNKSLVSFYKPKVIDILQNEWRFDPKIDLTGIPERYFSFIYEKKSEAINHDDCLIQCISEGILVDINKHIECNEISIDDNTALNAVISKNIDAITYYARHLICEIKDVTLQETLLTKANQLVNNSHILTDGYIVLQNGYAVNIEITTFSVTDLSEDNLNNMINEYRRADGQYLYEGVFMDREEVSNRIKARYVVYTIVFKYLVKTDGLIRLKKIQE